MTSPSADLLVDYQRHVRAYPVLRPDEIARLAHAVEVGALAHERLEAACAALVDGANAAGSASASRLDVDERSDLAFLVAAGEAARDRLVLCNLRLVLMVARRQICVREMLPDVVQSGTVGLIKAVERFDHRRGYRFSTYAVIWIRQAIAEGLAEQDRMIRLPQAVSLAVPRVARARGDLAQRTTTEPSVGDIARHLGIPAKDVKLALASLETVGSLDQPGAGVDDAGEPLAYTGGLDVAERVARRLLPDYVRAAIELLDEREQRLVTLRFGMDDGVARSFEDIGSSVGVTRERARQIVLIALAKIRRSAAANDLRGYLT